jgi:hypothetical protein
MKTTLPLLLVLGLMHAGAVMSQKPIELREDSIKFGTHSHPGIILSLPEVPYESVQKSWVKLLESGTKSKAVYENGIYTLFGGNIKDVSPNPVNIYSRLDSRDSVVYIMTSVELKEDTYVQKGSAETELAGLKTYLKGFAKEQYLDLAKKQLDDQEKQLRSLEKELSSYEKDESDLEKSIRSDEKTIKEQEESLQVMNTELTNLSTEVLTQTNEVNAMPEGTAKEERSKYLKDLEKKKKKLTGDIKSAENRISKSQRDIRTAQNDIPDKQVRQKETKTKIEAQQAVVRKFENKYNTIKGY